MRAKLDRMWWPAAVFLVGALAATGVAEAVGVPAKDTVTVLFESLAGAAAASAVAVVILFLIPRSNVSVQATVSALAPVVAVAIGVSWATSQMFITEHDLGILWVVLVAAGTAGVAAALILGHRVAQASKSVGEMARRLGEAGPLSLTEGGTGAPEPAAGPGELAALADQLRHTSKLLAEAQLRAEATERSRRELVAWVSHDLRTPLSGIRAMIEALEDRVVQDPLTVLRYYATIRLETDHLAGLVDDLFELSRIQSGVLALEWTPVGLDEIIAEATEGARVAARAKGLTLRNALSDPPPVVEIATAEMTRVIRNLLDNAIRHTRPGGAVTLTAGLDPDGALVEVSVLDECGGIPEDDLGRVFEMGYRGDEARTPGEGRGGLGLAVAQGLVQAHAGQITVNNEGPGCCFTVRLPVRHQFSSTTSGPG
jgi:signal transduction histidine kinase